MYFGNNEGLLAYDGEHWQLHKLPQSIVARAVAADGKGRVYVGGFAEFGYWSYNKEGRFAYTSLIPLVPESVSLRNEIWKIYVDGSKVYFQSFSTIYIYENGKIRTISGQGPFLFLLKAGNKYFIERIDRGLYQVQGDSLRFIANGVLGKAGVHTVLPFGENKFLIGTSKDGLFLYDGQEVKPWANEANDFLKQYQLNNGALVQGKYFAFGTILNGVVILDAQGRLVQHINKLKGLQNNTVLSLYPDKEQNLWAGLDNGIDRINVNSPLFYYFDTSGKFGTVYTSIIHDNKIYLGTNQGLFYSEWSDQKNLSLQSFDFKMIEDTQGQVWDLSLVEGQLLCGHNEGTYLVKGTKVEKISDVKGGWIIKKINSNPDLLLQGTYTGLVVYKKDSNGNWSFSHKIRSFNEPSLHLEEDNAGNLWVSHDYRGLHKLRLSDDLASVKTARKYDQRDGLPGNINIHVFKLENRTVFSSDSGFYVYDEISDKFIRYKELNQKLGKLANASKVIKATGQKYWLINQGRVAMADFSKPGTVDLNTSQFTMLNGHMVQLYENISRISNSMYLISIDNGFVVYNEAVQQQRKRRLPAVLIRNVHNTTNSFTTLTESGAAANGLEIPYKENNLRITYALPYYSPVQPRYQYYLEGYSSSWSDWSSASEKDFTNLDWGKYRFLVRAKVGEEAESPVTVFEFRVLPPWYATTWAYLLYGLLAILLLFLFRHLYYLKLKRDQQRIHEKLEREKEEYLQQEALANEQRIIKLKNEQLEAELASKSRELANSALNIVSKNELLQSLKDELAQLKDAGGKKLPEDHLKKIQKIIGEGMSSERDWNLFENSFNEAHENYFRKLKAMHPELSPNDLRFCAFLRMNMSSKEIASLLNITVRGVEIRRYRLRKKMGLEHEKNLVEYLMEVQTVDQP